MHTLVQPCKSLSLHTFSLPLHRTNFLVSSVHNKHIKSSAGSIKSLFFSKNISLLRGTHLSFCSQDDALDKFSSAQLPERQENDGIQDNEELELLNKPSPVALNNGLSVEVEKEPEKIDTDEALAPFLKFFKTKDSLGEVKEEESELDVAVEVSNENNEVKKVIVDYYEPKPGDFVVGVVVSGNENKLDVNVGADLLGTMLTKEVLPLYDKEMDYLLCDMEKDAESFMVRGKMGIIKDEAALSQGSGQGRPVVETGTILFAEVLGRTLSGRPLLSTRRLFRRLAWHRARQIKELNEPIEVELTKWNTGGLLTRIEGLRAFLPKIELVNRVNNFKELKDNVGRRTNVLIIRINESNNELVLSEREAWERLNLREGTLLEGIVRKVFTYGAQVRIGGTNRSGLVHISNISRNRVTDVSELLKVDEKVKVLVVKSDFPDKISLSIADLESEPGLFISNKERVFAEAEEMARKYRKKLPAVLAPRKSADPLSNTLPFDEEETMYSNWKWFKFERD
ncbi:protein PIGMENT DEFECTIVE 338, chloroplastic [Mercurialis annua]|uniref:protein PIGMENT DEFECTIVE 338, chloroplastic n=1 Tax=Mercurialis annua TaxID=3986 RepID=UPI00215EB88C|nr:protein PIGMENT DEFECTIVE 338, chloroplastic [Mercurialis annua]